LLDVD
jgi:hypothetical protein